MRKASNIVTYIWSKGDRRFIDKVTKLLFDLRVIEQYDAIPIKNRKEMDIGAFYLVTGNRILLDIMSKLTDRFPGSDTYVERVDVIHTPKGKFFYR